MSDHGTSWEGPSTPVRMGGRIRPLDPATYTGRMRRIDMGAVAAEVITAGPHRFDRTEDDLSQGRARIVTLVVGDGRLHGHVDGRTFDVRRGDVLVLDDRHPTQYSAPTGMRVLRVLVDVDAVPPFLLNGEPLPADVIRRTKLVNSAVAFFSTLFAKSEVDDPSDDPELNPHLREALLDLVIALIAEARAMTTDHEDQPRGDLRDRIEDYVADHLGDASLSPVSIAAALGISVRYAHQVFNREETTLSRYIRERRLDGVAAELRDGGADQPLGELGSRFGFGSRDQLSRGFRQRFGRTMGEYRAEHHAGQGANR